MPFPPSPSYRMSYDTDGTQGLYWWDADKAPRSLTQAEMEGLNSENTTYEMGIREVYNAPTYTAWIGFVFPERRRLVGGFICGYYSGFYMSTTWFAANGTWNIQTSTNSTNGIDGTWISAGQLVCGYGASGNYSAPSADGRKPAIRPYYRQEYDNDPNEPGWNTLQGVGTQNVKAVRFHAGSDIGGLHGYLNKIHLYGYRELTAAVVPRLAIWHPTVDEEVGPDYFDYQDFEVASTEDRDFRVKNLSTVENATNISIYVDAPTEASPSVANTFQVSSDGVSFNPMETITTLSPGALSGIFTLRRTTPSGAQLSAWTARLLAEAGAWT